jgi:hypothetical protein
MSSSCSQPSLEKRSSSSINGKVEVAPVGDLLDVAAEDGLVLFGRHALLSSFPSRFPYRSDPGTTLMLPAGEARRSPSSRGGCTLSLLSRPTLPGSAFLVASLSRGWSSSAGDFRDVLRAVFASIDPPRRDKLLEQQNPDARSPMPEAVDRWRINPSVNRREGRELTTHSGAQPNALGGLVARLDEDLVDGHMIGLRKRVHD